MTGVWVTADVITAARMNEKTIIQGSGSTLSGLTTYAGMLAYCTSAGSGFVADVLYVRNAANSAWSALGVDQLPYLTLSTTIGDYTSPNAAVATSEKNYSPSTESYDTAGTDTVVNMDTTNNRCGEKVTSTTTRLKYIKSMTMRLKSAGGATGTLSYKIRKSSDNSVAATSTDTLNASTLTTSGVNYTLNFNFDQIPNETYYAVVEGIASGQIEVIGTLSDTSANGNTAYWSGAAWNDLGRDTRMSIEYTDSPDELATFIYDGSTSTKWTSDSEASPAIYVDLSGSAREIVGVALAINTTDTTVTAIKIRASTDTSFADAENIAYLNVSDFTDDTYRYIANNFLAANCRYVQVIGVGTGVLSVAEIKVRYGVSDTVKILTHKHRTRNVSAADSFTDSN